jgi:hypothetical protein
MAKGPTRKTQPKSQASPRKTSRAKAVVEVRATTAARKKKQSEKRPAKAAHAGSRRAPTTVMGVTIPTGLTNALDSLVNSQRGRELLASALVAAAGAAAAALVKASDGTERREDRPQTDSAGAPLETATRDLSMAAAGALADMASGAVRSLLPASLTSGKADRSK